MDVDDDRHAVGEHCIDGAIEAADKVRVEAVGGARIFFQRDSIDAETHMVEAEARHERYVVRVRVSVGARCGVVAGGLRKPLGCVDAMLQVAGTRKGCLQPGGTILRGRSQNKSEKNRECDNRTAQSEMHEDASDKSRAGINWTRAKHTMRRTLTGLAERRRKEAQYPKPFRMPAGFRKRLFESERPMNRFPSASPTRLLTALTTFSIGVSIVVGLTATIAGAQSRS